MSDFQKKDTFTPINKGQFTLDTPERVERFEGNRGSDDPIGYKEYRKKWSEYPKQQYVSDYPLHVDLELASICNLKCPMCYTITPEFKDKVNAKLMDFNLFKKIINEIGPAGVYSIRISFRGESFLHKNVVEAVRYAKENGIKEVSTLTNGLRLDEEMFKEIMLAGIDWITISFDGLGETYEKIRHPAKFNRAVEKIRNYQQIKREYGRVKPVIKVQSVLPAIQDNPQAYYDVFAPITDLVSSNPLIDFMQDKATMPKMENFACPQIYERLVVGADGLCMMCSNDEEGKIIVGDANRQSIHEIWHGDEMSRIRAIHQQHKGCESLTPCSQCYLPLKTYPEEVRVGERAVVAEKYVSGVQKVVDLKTPDKFKRSGLNI